MKRFLFLLALLASSDAHAARAQTVIQSGPWAPGHFPVYYPMGAGTATPLVIDGGAAGGTGATIQGGSEQLLILPTSPTGPLGTNWCDYSANPSTSTAGYYYLCFSPNHGGAGTIVYGAVGLTPQPLNAVVNGVSSQIGGGSSGSIAFPATITGGASGGVPYFSADTTLSASPALAASQIMIGGGAGNPPATTSTGGSVLTALSHTVNSNAGMALVNGSPTAGDCLKWSSSGVQDGGACGGLVVGTAVITGGTNTRIEYNNAGVLGEYAISGSGAVAMTTSPAFTTPNLGTPSAVNLSNGTNLPISTGVSGLGTGVGTALATASNNSGGFPSLNGNPTAGHLLQWSSSGIQDAGAGGTGLTVGSTTVGGGASGSLLYDNAGVLGELTSIPVPVNAQVGTTYTVLSTDNGKLVTFSNGSAIAVTLPQAVGSFGSGFNACLQNLSTGLVTITPTTSSINGGSTLTLWQNQGVCVASDGANYQIGGEYTGHGTAYQILSANSSGNGYSWTSTPRVRAIIAGVTAPTDGSGACTASSIVGGSSGGKFVTSTGCSANSVVLNLATAPTGWACTASDVTTSADSLKQSDYSTTSVTFTGTTVNADVITYQCTGF